MAKIVGSVVAIVLFSIVPAVLIALQYSVAAGIAFFSVSLGLLQIWWDISDIKDALKETNKCVTKH